MVKSLTIDNSYIEGYERIGTIAGVNYGTISNCISQDSKITGNAQLGGIVGDSQGIENNIAFVSNCINYGEVSEIYNDEQSSDIAGIVGVNYYIIKKCINSGKINYDNSTRNYGIVFGTLTNNSTSINCFYINNNEIDGVGYEETSGLAKTVLAKTSEELKGLGNVLGDAYVQDDNINDGYPYLKDNKPLK